MKYQFTTYTKNMYLNNRSRFWSFMNNKRVAIVSKELKKIQFSGKTLEVGSYDGYNIVTLLEKKVLKNNLEFEGLDIYSIMKVSKCKDMIKHNLEILKKQQKLSKYKLIDKDILQFNIKEKYQQVLSFETIEHIKNEKKAIEAIVKAMKKNGFLVISVPVEKYLGAFLKELGRKIILRKGNHSWKETFNLLLGNMNKVKKIEGGHRGYDYERTKRLLEEQGLKKIFEKGYPLNIKFFDYGRVFIYKK